MVSYYNPFYLVMTFFSIFWHWLLSVKWYRLSTTNPKIWNLKHSKIENFWALTWHKYQIWNLIISDRSVKTQVIWIPFIKLPSGYVCEVYEKYKWISCLDWVSSQDSSLYKHDYSKIWKKYKICKASGLKHFI